MAKRVMKYNPAFLSPAELIDQFVVRHDDLQTLLQVVRENTTDANRHVLVIGPRGSGKTMLVRRVAAEINRDPQLRDRWYPLIFSEESYQVTTPGEFWLEATFHLGQQTKDPRWQAKYDQYGSQWQDEDAMRERALGQLMAFADQQGKRLLLIVESFNTLLGDQISADDAWKLRHTLQNEPRVMLLATATSRFEEIDQPDKAMYELFRVQHLRPLDRDQCRVLWQALTDQLLEGDRVRPIQILTGGNLRLLTILSTFGARLSLRQLMGDLVGLVDEHTEYFKSHLDALPAVERKVYLALAELWDPSTARGVAAAARLDVNRTSSLLRRLVDRGAVLTLDEPGRTKWYQVAERMYNVYYLFRRRGSPAERVRAVVRFMIGFYQPEQLVTVAHRIADEVPGLAPSDRLDHYQVYYDLMTQVSSDSLREKLVEVARDKLCALHDVPDFLARMVRPPTHIGKAPPAAAQAVARAVEEGILHIQDSRFAEAEKASRKALQVDPDFVPALALLGAALDGLSDFEEAELAYQKAIQIDPHFAWAWAGLGKLLHERLSRFAEAENAYRSAVELDPRHASVWAALGTLLDDELCRFEEAAEAYRKALEIDSQHAVGWTRLGILLHTKLSRFDDAEQAYRTALEIDPRNAEGWVLLGWLLHAGLSRFDEAEKAYRRAIEIDPRNLSAWGLLGTLLQDKLSRFGEAEQAYRKAIEIDPQFGTNWAQLGWLLDEKLSRSAEAEEAFRKGIEVEPQNPKMRVAMLKFLSSRPGRQDEVVQFAGTTVDEWPDDPLVLNACAWALWEPGGRATLDQALTWAERAVEIGPDDGNYRHTLASIQCALGSVQDALKTAETYLADEKTVRDTVANAVDLFVELAARGEGPRALQILLDSPSRDHLEPLVVGIRIFLGEDVKVAAEIKEIGLDVARRIEQRRDALGSA